MTIQAMSGRERILAALAGERTDVMPVAIDYMQLFLAEETERRYVAAYRPRLERQGRVRLDPDEDTCIRAEAIEAAYYCCAERHDWLSAGPGPTRRVLAGRDLLLENGHVFEVERQTGARRQLLLSGQESKTEEYRGYFERVQRASKNPADLAGVLGEWKAQTMAAYSDFGLSRRLIEQAGGQYFTYAGAGAPFWRLYGVIGFEGMMTALYDAPQMVHSMMDFFLQFALEQAQAFKDAGGDAIRLEECLASADIISERSYEEFALPYEEKLFGALRRMGLKVLVYFCGDVMPRLAHLRELPIDALLVEESKKDFTIEIGAVRAVVGDRLCLWGNVDSYEVVQRGSLAQIDDEVTRQQRVAGAAGAFVLGLGSPLPLDTPPARVDALIRSARRQPTLH